jgi:hypothetical protein
MPGPSLLSIHDLLRKKFGTKYLMKLKSVVKQRKSASHELFLLHTFGFAVSEHPCTAPWHATL